MVSQRLTGLGNKSITLNGLVQSSDDLSMSFFTKDHMLLNKEYSIYYGHLPTKGNCFLKKHTFAPGTTPLATNSMQGNQSPALWHPLLSDN